MLKEWNGKKQLRNFVISMKRGMLGQGSTVKRTHLMGINPHNILKNTQYETWFFRDVPQLQNRDHGINGPKNNHHDEYKLTKNIFPGTSDLPKTDGTDANKCDASKSNSNLASKSNVPCKTNTEHSSSDGMDECTSWHSRQVCNYFSVFNVQGSRLQTVQSFVPYATSYPTNVDVNLNQSGSRGTLDDFNSFGENIEWTEINRVIRNHDWVMEFKDLPTCLKATTNKIEISTYTNRKGTPELL